MNYEPLEQKKHQLKKQMRSAKKETREFYQGFEQGIDDAFDVFANYVDLYKRYKNDLKLLMEEQKPVWKHWVTYYDAQKNVDKNEYLGHYNNWLFDYIFLDGNNKSEKFFEL
jgi:hypothetical protein